MAAPRPPVSATLTWLRSALTKSAASWSLPPRVVTEPQAARTLNFPLPEVRGLGDTISTSSLMRSGQSWIPNGLSLWTTNTIVDVYGTEWFGSRFCQSDVMSPRLRSPATSLGNDRDTTSDFSWALLT